MNKIWIVSWDEQVTEDFNYHDMTTRYTEEEAQQVCEELKKKEGVTNVKMYESVYCSM